MTNTIDDIRKFIKDKMFNNILILCGKNSFSVSGAEEFFFELKKRQKIKFLTKRSKIPIFEELIEIIKEIKNFKPDLIIAVGGGTIIDYAKMANVVDIREDLKNLIINYSYPFKKKFANLLVIPTTAGSGAEVTSNAVIYLDGIKHSFESELLVPDKFFFL